MPLPPSRFPSLVPAAILTVVSCGPSQPAATPIEQQAPAGATAATATTDALSPTPDTSAEPTLDVPTDQTTVTACRLAAGVEPGRFQLDAYVIELRPCPECPPPLSCKPCLGEHVVVHDEPSPTPDAHKPMLRMKPGQLTQVEAGKRYRFQIDAVGEDSTVNHIEVVSFAPLP